MKLSLSCLARGVSYRLIPRVLPIQLLFSVWLLSSLLQGAAQAGFIPFASLLVAQSAPGLYPNLPTIALPTQSGPPLLLGIRALGADDAGKVNTILVLASKEQLGPEELALAQQWFGNAAVHCFNISPERLGSMNSWLARQNALAPHTPQRAHFGPLELTYRQWQYSAAQTVASVVLGRAGTPGEEPWTNGCSLP